MLRYTAQKVPNVNIKVEQMAQAVTLEFQRIQNAMNTAGGHKVVSRTITASDIVSSTDGYVYGDTTSAAVTATLPYASDYSGMVVGFKKVAGSSAYTVRVDPNGADLIINSSASSSSSLAITAVAIRLHSDGIATWNQI